LKIEVILPDLQSGGNALKVNDFSNIIFKGYANISAFSDNTLAWMPSGPSDLVFLIW